ncbi:MAG TPA: hypothetical protein VFA03_11400 [Acetobacteraceae bacterium]|nr:hypothetical protein [Acetobacteraceae bacterium]
MRGRQAAELFDTRLMFDAAARGRRECTARRAPAKGALKPAGT